MAHPRKFSEKIALQKQRQAEETAEFEKVMREISKATLKLDETNCNQKNSSEIRTGINPTMFVQRESRDRNVGVGPMRRPSDRNLDRSPYNSGNITYLSPPTESHWRRTNSDSAIHQNVTNKYESHPLVTLSSDAQSKTPQMYLDSNHKQNFNNSLNKNLSNVVNTIGQEMPCSSWSPRLIGANTNMSSHMLPLDNSLYYSVGNNAGSLPDLSSVHYSSIKNEPTDDYFSHSPQGTPAEFSPASVPSRCDDFSGQIPAFNNIFNTTARISSKNHWQQNNKFPTTQENHLSDYSYHNLPSSMPIQQGDNIKDLNKANNNAIHGSPAHLSPIAIRTLDDVTNYRTPQSYPSPGTSPGLQQISCTNESNPSASCSPNPHNFSNSNENQTYENYQNLSNEGYGLSPSFQNHFEQFSLVDNLCSSQNNFDSTQFDDNMYSNYGSVSGEISQENYAAYNNGTEKYMKDDNLRQMNYSTQSKPEIIFSDYSTTNPDTYREIFDALEIELGPLEIADSQLISDPNAVVIADPKVENSFRRDFN